MSWSKTFSETGVSVGNSFDSSTFSKKIKRNTNINLSPNSKAILENRYLRKNADGTFAETIEEMFERVAKVVAAPDEPYCDVKQTEIEFYNLLTTKKFFPNSPTFTGAGTPLGQLAACFVLPIDDDLGRVRSSIFESLRIASLIQQTGGGIGFSFSRLREAGSVVNTSKGSATGPVGFIGVYDAAFGEIAQGGVRRGANMGVLRVDHPDIREFIKCKTSEGSVSNFNISVAVTDKFMQAVKDDTTYDLVSPHTKEIVESLRARDIYELIIDNSFKNGEPGILYIDRANKTNPVPHMYELEATNPCGEQWLGPYENCCLGSINLAEHLVNSKIDWNSLKNSIRLATKFLDNVVSANKYVPDVPELREAAIKARRIGLGFMGLADVMYALKIRYGSKVGQELAAKITEFIRFHSMQMSIELAKERGAFPGIKGSIYDPNNLTWEIPKPINAYENDFGRPFLDWKKILADIKRFGIRNAAQTTIAPTGTISTVAGVEGYGCEPTFALAYMRNVYQAAGTKDKMTLTYVSPKFETSINDLDLDEPAKEEIIKEIVKTGTCQNIDNLPDSIKNTFVVSSDITAEEHIQMQAAIQAFIDNSISKTCNFPESATVDDVAKAYMLGWELGCKGLTVYVAGSRQEVVLEVKGTKDEKEVATSSKAVSKPVITQRTYKLSGNTYKMQTPQGKAFITVNRDENKDPFEVFIGVGKAGSDVAALSEAMGRLLSGWLRSSSKPLMTIKEIISQLIGIGGARSVGFGNSRVGSIPDAVAKVLSDEFEIAVRANGSNVVKEESNEISVFSNVDMCPDCGNSSLIKEEGCEKCYECGYSVC